jgi:hypothetical protein
MSILNYFISSSVQDFVGVFDENFNQVFPTARILKPVVKPTAKGMEQPLESGKTVTDHVIIQPLELELTMIITGAANIDNTYQSIYNYFINHTLLTVQTKTSNYSNLYILEMPHEESPDQYDAVSLILNFKQAFIASSTMSKIVPQEPANSDTVNRGTQIPRAPNPDQTTIAQDIINFGRPQ